MECVFLKAVLTAFQEPLDRVSCGATIHRIVAPIFLILVRQKVFRLLRKSTQGFATSPHQLFEKSWIKNFIRLAFRQLVRFSSK